MNSLDETTDAPIPSAFWIAAGLNFVWINLSEVFRYFVFVMPMMREAFPMLPDIAPMSWPVFLVWGIWDTILVGMVTLVLWLMLQRFGTTLRATIWSGTAIWMTVFVILWLGLYNMNLATIEIALVALPLAWVEMIVAAYIVRWVLLRGYPG